MTLSGSMEVTGLKEALRELQQLNPQLRREITKEYKRITAPVIKTAKAKVPQAAPISGWNRKWTTKSGQPMTPWAGSIGNKLIKAKVSGKKPREFAGRMTNLAVFSVAWSGTVNTLFDLAGRRSGGDTEAGARMIRALEARFGKASRILWPAYEMNRAEVEKQTAELVKATLAATNRRLS